MAITSVKVGERIECDPGHDCWMAGDRFGKVVKVGRKYVHVRMDYSRRVRLFPPGRVTIHSVGSC